MPVRPDKVPRVKARRRIYGRSNGTAILLSLTNTVAQTVVLGIALSSLASGIDEIPVPVATALEVAGLSAVAIVAMAGVVAHVTVRVIRRRTRNVVAEKEETESERRS